MTKRALVTGAAGFVGRHTVHELRARGYDVHVCDITGPMAWTMHDFNDVIRWNTNVYDLVVHCAAVGAHRAAIDGQPMTFAQNMQLDAALFHWAIKTRQRRVLYISSSAAYPRELQNVLSDEHEVRLKEDEIDLNDPRAPFDTYGITKLTGEHLAGAARDCGVPVTVVRPFSGYGEDQGTEWPFGAFVQRIRDGENPFTIWGSAKQQRDWIHIDDVVNGMLAVATAQGEGHHDGEPINLCTGQETAIGDLAILMFQAKYDEYDRWPAIVVDETKPLGVLNRVGDPTRFFEYYQPKVTLEDGVYRALKTKD